MPATEDWLELRVHGVSGTPAPDLLGRPGSQAIPGENLEELPNGLYPGQFWRRTDEIEPPHELQAYHWGEYTSQSHIQGLWILMLPFGIVNTAQFMLPLPATAVQKLLHAMAGSCLRVIGLVLSLLAFLGVACVTIDLIGWYGIGHQAGRHYGWLGIAALLTAVLLIVVGRISRQDAGSRTPVDEGQAPADGDSAAQGLRRRKFYTGVVRSPDARRLHSAGILAMLGILAAWPGAQYGSAGMNNLLRTAKVLLLLVAVVVAVSGDPEGGSSIQLNPGLDGLVQWSQKWALRVASWSGWLVSMVLLGGIVVETWRVRMPSVKPEETLPGFDNVATWLLVTALGGLALLLVAAGLLAALTQSELGERDGRCYAFRRYAWGLASWFVAALGVFVGVGYAGAFAVLPAVAKGGYDCLFEHTALHIPFPTILQRVLFAWGWTLFVLAVIPVLVVVRCRALRDRYRAAAAAGYAEVGTVPTAVANRVAFRMFCARLKNLIPVLAIGFATLGCCLSIAAAIVTFGWPGSGSVAVHPLAGSAGWLTVVLQILGALGLTGLVGFLGYLTYHAYRSPNSRRVVNIVWDVMCFWPRSVHPLTPTAYSQFAVAELCKHLREEVGHRRVVIAAHSQGSLISLAALLWLSDAERSRVGFLSFGSQLRQIYPRAFPGFVNTDILAEVRDGLGNRWTNLYRDTDHIAGPLFSWAHYRTRGEDPPQAASWPDQARIPDTRGSHGRRVNGPDWRLLDPELAANDQPPAADARPQNHSNYWLDNCWDDAISSVLPSAEPPLT